MHKLRRQILRFLLIVVISFSTTSIVQYKAFTPTVEAAVKAPAVKVQKKTLYVGYKAYQLELSNISSKAKISYKSSNSKIAKVSSKGIVTPVKKGNATITATIKQNNKTYQLSVKITVKNPYVSIQKKTDYMNVGEKYNFQAKAYGLKDQVSWEVSNKKLATINKSGVLTAKASGTVTVTASSGKKSAQYKVKIGKRTVENSVQSTVDITVKSLWGENTGAGFFIDQGVVVTGYHVIAGAEKITITSYDKKKYEVKEILGYDEKLDLAILSVDCDNTSFSINGAKLSIGAKICALGSPLKTTKRLSQGKITAASKVIDGVEYIKFDATVTQDNSGGALLNSSGEVIGVITMNITEGKNTYYAININELSKIMTNQPKTVKEYFDNYLEETEKNLMKNMITEDPAVSQDPNSCQMISPMVAIQGKIHKDEHGDYYRLEVSKATTLMGAIEFENPETLMNVNSMLCDQDGNEIASALPVKDNMAQILYIDLEPGRYYLKINMKQGYQGDSAPYRFVFVY